MPRSAIPRSLPIMPQSPYCAVIGDVGCDWAFLSMEPARPKAPAFQPWTMHPSTRLFAFPGGAWFSGHMVQAALGSPPFSRRYAAIVRNLDKPSAIHFDAVISHTSDTSQFPRCFQIEVPRGTDPYSLIVDDQHEFLLPYDSVVQVELTDALRRPCNLSLGLLEAQIDFRDQHGERPGAIDPNLFERRFRLNNGCLSSAPGQEKLKVSYLSLSAACGKLVCDRLSLDLPFMILRIMSRSARVHDFPSQDHVVLSCGGNARVQVHFARATLDDMFGTVKVEQTTTDSGKLGPPSSLARQSAGSFGVRAVLRQFPVDADRQLWIYEDPGAILRMQPPAAIVQTLSELSAFHRHADQKSDLRVFRRARTHGIDGPRQGRPDILNAYCPPHSGRPTRTQLTHWTGTKSRP